MTHHKSELDAIVESWNPLAYEWLSNIQELIPGSDVDTNIIKIHF